MSPRQLLDRLTSMGIIDPALIEKISREIENPEKTVKPKAVLNFLVKKGQITKSQAAMLVKEIDKPKPIEHEEIEVAKYVQPKKEDYDTDDLTSVVQEEVVAPVKKKIDPDATVMDALGDDDDQDVDIVTTHDVSEVEVEIDDMPAEVEAIDLGGPTYGGLGDPLSGPNTMATDADPYGSGANEGHPHVLGFKGKVDKRDQWATKWLYIGFGILGTLIIFGVILYIAVYRQTAEDRFKAAMAAFDANTWGDAIEKFGTFLEKHPKDDKAPIAKVRRVNALLAQTYEGKNWDETLNRAENLLPELMAEPDIDMNLIRPDLSVILPNTALEITLRAMKQKDRSEMERQLEIANRAKKVVDNPSYIPTTGRKRIANKLTDIGNNILTVQGKINKEDDYTEALGVISGLSDQKKTDEAFAVYDDLVTKYGDLGTREELQNLMKGVSAKETELVVSIDPGVTISTSDVESILDNTVVLASKTGKPIDSLRGDIVAVLAEGSLYGIDGGDGSVAWRRFVGYQTSIQPKSFDEDTTIGCSQKNNEVFKLDTRTGDLKWRCTIGEPFLPPAFNQNMVVITTLSGKVLKFDAQSGEFQSAVQLPQPATASAMVSETEPFIYQPGSYSNLYVLSSVDLTCKDVYYVGHSKGAITIEPMYWSGYMLLTVNGGNHADVHVIKRDAQATTMSLTQVLPKLTSGPVSTPLMRFGRWLLVAADNGDMKILEMDTTNEESPVRRFVEEKFENRTGQRPFFFNEGSQLWIGGDGIIKYKLQGSRGTVTRQKIMNSGDTFISPMTKLDETLIHVRRRAGSSMVSVSGVDSTSLELVWETRLGGNLAGPAEVIGNDIVAISGQGDRFVIDQNALDQGVEDDAVLSSTILTNLLFSRTASLPDGGQIAFGPSSRKDMLYVDPSGASKLIRLENPMDEIVCPPLVVGNDVVVASARGQVVRLEPATGRMVGSPFQPPLTPGSKVNWKTPIMISEGILVAARGFTAGQKGSSAVYLLDARNSRTLSEMARVDTDEEVKSEVAAVGTKVFVVMSNNEGDQIVAMDSTNKLSTVGSAQLGAGYAAGPWALGPFVLVLGDTDEMICFDADLNKKWSMKMPNDQMAGGPQIFGKQIMLPFSSGKVTFVNPETGTESNSIELGQPIAHAPYQAGQFMLFSGADGTVHKMDVNKFGVNKP